MALIGAFTVGTARHIRRGSVQTDREGAAISCTEIYGVMHEAGTMATPDNTPGLPSAGDAHTGAGLTHLLAGPMQFDNLEPTGVVWEIRIEYVRAEASESGEWGSSRVVARDWGTVSYAEDLIADYDTGEAVINAAGDPYDSVPQVDRSAPSVHFRRLESSHPATAIAYSGSVNSAEVTVMGLTFPAYTARIRISARDLLNDASLRYELDYTIERRNTWIYEDEAAVNIGYDVAVVEQGYYYLDGEGERQRFMESEEETGEPRPSAQPCLLDADGGDNRGGTPVIKRIAVDPALSWTNLRLPSS